MSAHPDLGRLDANAAEHARSCPDCLSALAGDDPTRIFSLLRVKPLEPSVLDAVSSAVASAVRGGESLRRPGRDRRFALVAAWACAAALAGILLTPRSKPAHDLAFRRAEASDRAAVHDVASPGTPSVVDLSVGEVKLVMIFDKEMDL